MLDWEWVMVTILFSPWAHQQGKDSSAMGTMAVSGLLVRLGFLLLGVRRAETGQRCWHDSCGPLTVTSEDSISAPSNASTKYCLKTCDLHGTLERMFLLLGLQNIIILVAE